MVYSDYDKSLVVAFEVSKNKKTAYNEWNE